LKEKRREDAMRTLRAVVLILFVVLVAAVAFSYLGGNAWWRIPRVDRPAATGTTGTGSVETARERGAEVGEKVAVAAARMRETAAEAALTSKIKAKMVLDDNIRARAIDVTTSGSIVTLSGTVRSVDEHDRAVRLARETAGVTQIVDQLRIDVSRSR
jgi:hyperosmotically inducible periplasmic protein